MAERPHMLAGLADRWRRVPAGAFLMMLLLLVAGLGVIFQNERSYHAQKLREANVQADILAASVTAALDFGDAPAARDSVAALGVNPQLRTAAVYDGTGALFTSFQRGDREPPARLADTDADATGIIAAAAPVMRGPDRIGTVRLTLAREPLSRRLNRYFLIGLFVVMAAVAVAVFGFAQAALRRANRALMEQIDETARAEEQLRQAQKMQALGQLTGGIAHDFNNLLTVIQGSADILQRPNLPEEKRTRFAAAISQTAARAATLTSQLLAFARRQPLRPETLDLNEQVVAMVDLLDRTLGERILVKTSLSPDICLVDADPVQLESAVLNIAVNARDAMADNVGGGNGGGTLTLATAPADLPNGDAGIALAISDTGAGMDADTMARVFEPFFTTKDVGRGTGLGLSQVYGFATQSGGDIAIASTPGKGTTVTLILPCSTREPAPAPEPETRQSPRPRATGRILVVDDNEEVGAFAESLIEELGYRVVRAMSGEEALDLYGRSRIDAVFTDVVMPGMGGLELARTLRVQAPALPIVLTTGFSDRLAASADDYPVLLKPYKLEALAEALEKALAQTA